MAKIEKSNLSALFDAIKPELLPHVSLDVSHLRRNRHGGGGSDVKGVDLSGKKKIIFLCGAGNTGKSFCARWMGERSLLRDDGNPLVLISMDPINRDLAPFFGGSVIAPPAGSNAQTWFENVLSVLEKRERNAVVDFGGGDKVLLDLATEIPNFHLSLGDIEIVVLYFFTPRISDLDILIALETAGMQPRATGLVLNCGVVSDPSAFDQIRSHPAYQAVLSRGAIELWMPRHFAAAAVENRRLMFSAADAELNARDRPRNKAWLDTMPVAFGAVESWLP